MRRVCVNDEVPLPTVSVFPLLMFSWLPLWVTELATPSAPEPSTGAVPLGMTTASSEVGTPSVQFVAVFQSSFVAWVKVLVAACAATGVSARQASAARATSASLARVPRGWGVGIAIILPRAVSTPGHPGATGWAPCSFRIRTRSSATLVGGGASAEGPLRPAGRRLEPALDLL